MSVSNLEGQPGSHFLREHLGYHLVEGGENLHRQLRLDAAIVDQIIQGVGQGEAETAVVSDEDFLPEPSVCIWINSYLLPR